MTPQSIVIIFPMSMVILWVGLWLVKKSGRTLSRRSLLFILIAGIVFTGISLTAHNSRSGGEGLMTEYGWPHSFLFKWTQLDGVSAKKWTLEWGPLGSYVLVNVAYYFSIVSLLVGVWAFWRKRPTAEKKT